MLRPCRRFAVGIVAALATVVPAGLAWACVAPVSLTTASPTVQPGGSVHIIGRESGPGAPIEIHLDSATGPLLTTATGQAGGMTSKWEADVPVPADVPYGKHFLYAVQNYRNMNAVIPKTVIYVGTVPDPAPGPEARAGSLDVGSGPNGVSLFLIGLGVAAGGLLLVWGLSLVAGPGPAKPQAERVKAS